MLEHDGQSALTTDGTQTKHCKEVYEPIDVLRSWFGFIVSFLKERNDSVRLAQCVKSCEILPLILLQNRDDAHSKRVTSPSWPSVSFSAVSGPTKSGLVRLQVDPLPDHYKLMI